MIPRPVQLAGSPNNGEVLTVVLPLNTWAQIVDANVDVAAAIAVTKLANGTADQVLTTAGTTPTWAKIVNANVDNAAAIAVTKFANGTADQVLVTSGTTPTWAKIVNANVDAAAAIDVAKLAPGTANQVLQTNNAGTAAVWTSFVGATSCRSNKNMAASVTTADGDIACATAVAKAPVSSTTAGGYIGASVNGISVTVGDGTKVAVPCYFSGDGGTTARALRSVVAGDLLYWNGTVALYQLAATDIIDFTYLTAAA